MANDKFPCYLVGESLTPIGEPACARARVGRWLSATRHRRHNRGDSVVLQTTVVKVAHCPLPPYVFGEMMSNKVVLGLVFWYLSGIWYHLSYILVLVARSTQGSFPLIYSYSLLVLVPVLDLV